MPYKDTSAAAIAASALIELDGFLPGRGYLATASDILNSLMGWVYLRRTRYHNARVEVQ